MLFRSKLVEGRLIRRYKRFLADIQLSEGVVTAACPNTGSLMGCCDAGSRVWLSESDSATRKYRHTWELVQVGEVMVGINTGLPNALVGEAIADGTIPELSGYASMRREVAFGEERSRVDWLLGAPGRDPPGGRGGHVLHLDVAGRRCDKRSRRGWRCSPTARR